jgi:hypothetical protein
MRHGVGSYPYLPRNQQVEWWLAEPFGIKDWSMCRNIKTLFNFDPPAATADIRDASLQFVRKISGFHKPSRANEAVFTAAVDEISACASRLLHLLKTSAPPKNREEEAAKKRARLRQRIGA